MRVGDICNIETGQKNAISGTSQEKDFSTPLSTEPLSVEDIPTKPEHKQKQKSVSKNPLVHSPALLSLLRLLHTVRSSTIEVVVSSLEPEAFTQYEIQSGNKLDFLSLPVITTDDVATVMLANLTREYALSEKSQRSYETMCKMLAQFAGPIPRHFVDVLSILEANIEKLRPQFASGRPENRAHVLNVILTWWGNEGRVSVDISPPGQHYPRKKQQFILLQTMLWAMSPTSTSTTLLDKCNTGNWFTEPVVLSAFMSGALVLPTSPSGTDKLLPSIVGIFRAVRALYPDERSAFLRPMVKMLSLWIEDESGLNAEVFHTSWDQLNRVIYHQLHLLKTNNGLIPLSTFYHLKAGITRAWPGLKEEERLSTQEADRWCIDVRIFQDALTLDLDQFVNSEAPCSFCRFTSNSPAVDWGFHLTDNVDHHQASKMLCLGQQKVSRESAKTKYRRSDVIKCYNRTKNGVPTQHFVFLWAAIREFSVPNSLKPSPMRRVLILPRHHLLGLYGPFCVLESFDCTPTASHAES